MRYWTKELNSSISAETQFCLKLEQTLRLQIRLKLCISKNFNVQSDDLLKIESNFPQKFCHSKTFQTVKIVFELLVLEKLVRSFPTEVSTESSFHKVFK